MYIKSWLDLKPYKKQTKTDRYYLGICNEVKNTITKNKHYSILQEYLNHDELDVLSCFLTSYFEDLISETNIWNSFVSLHKKMYNKPLPFDIVGDYYEKEVNSHDLSFLIWYFLNTSQNEIFVSPFNGFINSIAEDVMPIFDDAWEYAPENNYLKSFYQINENEEDYYVVRKLIDTILFKTHLFYPDTLFRFEKAQDEII